MDEEERQPVFEVVDVDDIVREAFSYLKFCEEHADGFDDVSAEDVGIVRMEMLRGIQAWVDFAPAPQYLGVRAYMESCGFTPEFFAHLEQQKDWDDCFLGMEENEEDRGAVEDGLFLLFQSVGIYARIRARMDAENALASLDDDDD